jgi:methyl-accepting chemotaxis protein
MIRLLRSTSVRLALGFAGLFIASSLILVGILWWQTASYLDREIDAVILADANAVGDGLRNFGLRGAIDAINARIGRSGDANALYFLADPTLSPIAGNLAAWPLTVPRATGWFQTDMVHGGELHETRLLHVRLADGFHLLIGRDVHDREAIRRLVLVGLGWAGGAALVLAVLGGLLVRRAALQRVELINRTAAAIVEGDLAHRVPLRQSGDEFDQLAATVNRMLEQIQTLVEGVRNVSNAIAHDLRTPLAELRVRLEALAARRAPRAGRARHHAQWRPLSARSGDRRSHRQCRQIRAAQGARLAVLGAHRRRTCRRHNCR